MASVFEDGELTVLSATVAAKPGEESPPPKPLLVAAPHCSSPCVFPVVILFHGFCLSNLFYRQLMLRIASHGFVVVAPQVPIHPFKALPLRSKRKFPFFQMYRFAGPDASPEIDSAAAIINWIPGNLHRFLPDLRADATKIAIAGHSRGGKVAFSLALGFATPPLAIRVSALIALDPVDGTSSEKQTNPPVLRRISDSLQLNCPALIIATGYGGEKKNSFFPPCAPLGVGPRAFFQDCCPPSFLISVPEHGHFDFLDDTTAGIKGKITSLVGKNGKSRKPMRDFVAGAIVAFLREVFGDGDDFRKLLRDPGDAPVKLDPPESKGEIRAQVYIAA